jgi:hypothetical protein
MTCLADPVKLYSVVPKEEIERNVSANQKPLTLDLYSRTTACFKLSVLPEMFI